MTAIVGLVSEDATPCGDHEDKLLRNLGPLRSADIAVFSKEDVLLAHLHTGTGQSTHTIEDARHPIIVCGDMRIDNRIDIARKLDIGKGAAGSDADLIRTAYLHWGPVCLEKLIGDFAIVIWDTREKSLFCCRDHFGVRPLFYQQTPRQLTFASEAKMLPGYDERSLRDEYLSAFLANIPSYEAETPHPGISRLMPGHWMKWQRGQLTIRKYWELEVEPTISTDPAEEFAQILETAVTDRLVAPSRFATFLSGGLDSSAITGISERVQSRQCVNSPLRTYSFVYENNARLDERPFIDDLHAKGTYSPRFLPMDDYRPLEGIDALLRVQEGPVNAPALLKMTRLYEAAVRDGTEVVLDGHGGDEVVGYGTGRLWELSQSGKWLSLIPLVRTHSRLQKSSASSEYLQLLEKFGSGGYHTRAARWLLRHWIKKMGPPSTHSGMAWRAYLAPDYVKDANLLERSRACFVLTPEEMASDQYYQLRALSPMYTASAFETLHKSTAAAGLELRYPFFDVRLVQFCLGLASSEKLRRNETRSVLRRAMKDVYPPSIAKRQDKTNFSSELAAGLVRHHDDILVEMGRDPHGRLAHYFDMDKLRTGLEKLRQDPLNMDGGTVMLFWRAALFHLWMEGRLTSEGSVQIR